MAELVVPFRELVPKQRALVEEATKEKSSFFVEGPPGTGKTCVSLHVVRSLIGEEVVKPLVLIYNHSLLGYLRSSFDQLGITDSVTISTKDSFYWSLKRQYGITVDNDEDFNEKRKKILEKLIEKDIDLSYSIMILDEIQDFTDLEWRFLKTLSDRFILLGDFEQSVYPSNLKKESLLKAGKHRLLDKIFRFGEMIAELVGKFSKSSGKLSELVEIKNDTTPIIFDCSSVDEENQEIVDIIKAKRNDGGRIAIISINRDRLAELHEFLTEEEVEHLYVKSNKEFGKYDFSSNTPVLITSASAKGLEFSTVLVTGFDKGSRAVYGFTKYGGLIENIYVSLSRATENLYILRNPETIDELNELEVSSDGQRDEEDIDWF